MSKIQLVILSVFLISSVSSLRLDTHSQAIDNVDTYLQGLQSQQSKFEEQIGKLQENVDNTLYDAQNAADIASKISVLENGILSQEDELFLTSTTLIPVLVLKDQCTNITEADKTKLIQKCQTTILDIQTLQAKLQTLPQDARVLQMQANANHQIYYLQTIQKVLKQNCTTSTILSPTVYQSNIYASNWITGNQTMNDIVNQYVARSQQYDNITNCPLDTPFYNNIKCVQCSGTTPIFDMKDLKCTACPPNSSFNVDTRACVAVPPTNVTNQTNNTTTTNVTNQTNVTTTTNQTNVTTSTNVTNQTNTTTPVGKVYNATNPTYANNNTVGTFPNLTSYDVPCPKEAPFFYNGSCVHMECPPEYPHLVVSIWTCQRCASGTVYNSTLHDCVSATNLANVTSPTNATNQTNVTTPTNVTNGTNVTAPTNITTPTNVTNQTNVTAPTNVTNQTNVTTPKTPTVVKPYNATNPTYANNNTIGTFPNLTSYDVPCPKEAPFFYSGSCVHMECPPDHPHLVPEIWTCQKCPSGTAYNSTQHDCTNLTSLTKPSNITNVTQPTGSNPAASNRTIGNLTTTSSPCPVDKPFFDGIACINCTDPQPLFDAASLICTSCPTGTEYNSTTHNCTAKPAVAKVYNATNPTYANNNTIGTFPNLTSYDVPCPKEAPFFYSGSCVHMECPPDHPHLVPEIWTCQRCINGTVYNSSEHNCVPITNVTTPTNVTNVTKPNATNPTGIPNTIGSTTPAPTNPVYCPTETPFFNGTGCQSCPLNTPYFNTVNKTCQACQNGTVLNTTSHACENLKPNASNPSGVNNTIGDLITAGPSDIPCSPTTPYYVNGTCIACSAPTPYFNQTSGKCVGCPTGYQYNATSHSCSFIPPFTNNLAAGNWVATYPVKSITQTTQSINNQSKKACPLDKPYFDGVQCIVCSTGQYFDLDTKKCISCPTGSAFDSVLQKCAVTKPASQTNPSTAANISVGDTPLKQWQAYYTNNKTANPTIKDCVDPTPYYNGVKCVPCPADYPYFDLTIKDCIQCTGDYQMSANKQCISSTSGNVLTPNLASMTANAMFHHKVRVNHRHQII